MSSMDLHRLRVVEFDSLVSEKEDEKKNIAELEKRKQEDCKNFNSDENYNATNELIHSIRRRGSASPPNTSKITSFIKTKNEIFKSSPKAKLRKQDIRNSSAFPNLRKSFQDNAQNPKKRSFNLFNKKSRIDKTKEDIKEINESHKNNLEVNFLFARDTPSFIRYSRKRINFKRNKQPDRNDLFGFQQNRSVHSRLYQTSCNYLNVNKFSIKKVKNGFGRKPKLISPVPPVNDSYCQHHAMKILSSSGSSDKEDKPHSFYYNLCCQPNAAFPIQNNSHFEEIRENNYQPKAEDKLTVLASRLITVPKCCRDASAGPSQGFQGFQRRPVGTQCNACSAPRNVSYPRRNISYPKYSTPSPNSEYNCSEQHQTQATTCKRKRNNANTVCSIINNQRIKLYSAFIQRINAFHTNNTLGKKIIKYAFFGLLIVVWSPLLLAVILAWVVMCPVRFINIFARKNENNCQLDCSRKQNTVPGWYARAANTVAKSYNALLSMLKIRNKRPTGAGSSFISGTHLNPQRRYTIFYAENRGWMMKPARRIFARSCTNTRVVQTMRCETRPRFWWKVNIFPVEKPQKKVRSTQELFYQDPCCGASTRRAEKQVKSSQDLYCVCQKAQVKKGPQTMPYTVSKTCKCPMPGTVSCECPVHGTVSCKCSVRGTGKIASNKKAQVKKGAQTVPSTISKLCECSVRGTVSCECPVHGIVSCECPVRGTGKIASNKKAQVKKGAQTVPSTVSKLCECSVRGTVSCECPAPGTVSCECPVRGKIASNKKAQVKKGSQPMPCTVSKPCECLVRGTVSCECQAHGTVSCECPVRGTGKIASNKKAQVKKGSQPMVYTVSKLCKCPMRGTVSCECPVHGTVSCECPVRGTGKIASNKKAQVKKGSQTMPCTVSKPCKCPMRGTVSCECSVHGTVSCECPVRGTGKIASNKKTQIKKGSQTMRYTVSKPCKCPGHGTVSCECPMRGTGKIASNKKAQVKKGSQTIPYTPLKYSECKSPVRAAVSCECAVYGSESCKHPAQRTVSCECLMDEKKTCPGSVRRAKRIPWLSGKSSAAGDAFPTEITCYYRELQAQRRVSSKVSAKSIPQRKQVNIPPNYSYPISGVVAHSTIYKTSNTIRNNYNLIKITDTFQNYFAKYRLNQRKNGILPDRVIFNHGTKYPLIMNNETNVKHRFSLAGKTLTLSTKDTQNFTKNYSHKQASKKRVTKYNSSKTNNNSINNKKNIGKVNRERLSTRNKRILANLSRTILTKHAGTSTYNILFADKTQITSKQSLRHQVTDSATSKSVHGQKTKDSTILCNTTRATSPLSTITLNCPYDANNRPFESVRKPELKPIKLPSKKGLLNIGVEVKPSTVDKETLCNQNSNIKEYLPNKQEKALQKQPALIIKALNCPSKYEISVGTETIDQNKKMGKKTIERGCVTENQPDIRIKSTKVIALNCPSKNEVSVGTGTDRLKQSVYLTHNKLTDSNKNKSNIKTEKQSTISQTSVIGPDQISRLNENYLQIKPFNYPQYKNICHKERFPIKKSESYKIFIDSSCRNEVQPVVTDSETNTSYFELKNKSLENLSLKVNVSEDHSLKCKTALEHPYDNYRQITIPSDICNISEVKTSESPKLLSQTKSSLTTVPIGIKLTTVSTRVSQYGQSSKYRELNSQTIDRCFGTQNQPSTTTHSIQDQRHDKKRIKCICTDMPNQVQSHLKKQTSSKWDYWRKNCQIAATIDKTAATSSNKLQNEPTNLVRQPPINSKKQCHTQCTQVSSQRASDSHFGVVSNCPYCNDSNELLKPLLCQDKGQPPLYELPKKATTDYRHSLKLSQKTPCECVSKMKSENYAYKKDTNKIEFKEKRPCQQLKPPQSQCLIPQKQSQIVNNKSKYAHETELELRLPGRQSKIKVQKQNTENILCRNDSGTKYNRSKQIKFPHKQHHDFKIFSRKIKSLQKLCKILQEQAQTLEALKHPNRHTQTLPSMLDFGSNCFCKTYEPADKEEIQNCRTEAPIRPLSQHNRAAQTRSPIPIFLDKTHNKSCETSLERFFSFYKDKICTCKRESSIMWCKKRAIDCICRCKNKKIRQVHQSCPLDKVLSKANESFSQLLKCPEKQLPSLKTKPDQPSILSKRLSFDQSECTCEFDLQQNISQSSGKCIIVNKPQSQPTRCPSAFSKSQYSSQISSVHMECECPTSPRSSFCFCKPLRADKSSNINKNKKPLKSKPVQNAVYCSHEKPCKSSKTKKINQDPRNESLKQSSLRPCNETACKLESHLSKVSSLLMKLRSKLCSNKKSRSVNDSCFGKCPCPVEKARQSHTDKSRHKLEPVHSSSKKYVCSARQRFWQRLCTRSQEARTLETQSIKSCLDHPECNCRNNITSSLKCLSEGKSRKSLSLHNQITKNINSLKVSSKSKLYSKTTRGSYFDSSTHERCRFNSKYSKDHKNNQSMTTPNLSTVMSLTPIECICLSDDTSSTKNDDKSHNFLKQSRQSTLNLQKLSSQQHKMLQFPSILFLSPVNNAQINSSENQRLSSYSGSKQHPSSVPFCGPHKYGRHKTSPLLHVQTAPAIPSNCACCHEKPLQMAKKISHHSHKSVIEAEKSSVFPQQHLTLQSNLPDTRFQSNKLQAKLGNSVIMQPPPKSELEKKSPLNPSQRYRKQYQLRRRPYPYDLSGHTVPIISSMCAVTQRLSQKPMLDTNSHPQPSHEMPLNQTSHNKTSSGNKAPLRFLHNRATQQPEIPKYSVPIESQLTSLVEKEQFQQSPVLDIPRKSDIVSNVQRELIYNLPSQLPEIPQSSPSLHDFHQAIHMIPGKCTYLENLAQNKLQPEHHLQYQVHQMYYHPPQNIYKSHMTLRRHTNSASKIPLSRTNVNDHLIKIGLPVKRHVIVQRSELQNPQAPFSLKHKKSVVNHNESESPPHKTSISPKKTEPVEKPLPGLLQQRSKDQVQRGAATKEVQRYPDFNRVLLRYPGNKATRKRSEHKPPPAKVKNYPPADGVSHSPNYARRPCYTNPANKCGPKTCFDEFALRRAYKRRPLRFTPPKQQPQKKKPVSAPKSKKQGKKDKGKQKDKSKQKDKGKQKKKRDPKIKQKSRFGIFRCCQCVKGYLVEAEKEAWPTDITCRPLYIHALKHKPCFWIYRRLPSLYPAFLSCYNVTRNITRTSKYGIAMCLWSPCLLCFYICFNCLCKG